MAGVHFRVRLSRRGKYIQPVHKVQGWMCKWLLFVGCKGLTLPSYQDNTKGNKGYPHPVYRTEVFA